MQSSAAARQPDAPCISGLGRGRLVGAVHNTERSWGKIDPNPAIAENPGPRCELRTRSQPSYAGSCSARKPQATSLKLSLTTGTRHGRRWTSCRAQTMCGRGRWACTLCEMGSHKPASQARSSPQGRCHEVRRRHEICIGASSAARCRSPCGQPPGHGAESGYGRALFGPSRVGATRAGTRTEGFGSFAAPALRPTNHPLELSLAPGQGHLPGARFPRQGGIAGNSFSGTEAPLLMQLSQAEGRGAASAVSYGCCPTSRTGCPARARALLSASSAPTPSFSDSSPTSRPIRFGSRFSVCRTSAPVTRWPRVAARLSSTSSTTSPLWAWTRWSSIRFSGRR